MATTPSPWTERECSGSSAITFVGEVTDGKRVNARMINNSVGHPEPGCPRFSSISSSILNMMAPRSLSSLQRMVADTTGSSTARRRRADSISSSSGSSTAAPILYFRSGSLGMALAHVTDPADRPDRWKINQHNVPFARFTDHESIFYGSAVLRVGSYFYIYGVNSLHADKEGKTISSMCVARVSDDRLGDFNSWRFFSGGRWVLGFEQSDGLIPDMPTEFSVSLHARD